MFSFVISVHPQISPGAGTLHYHSQSEETGESNHILDIGTPATLGSAVVGRPGSEEWGLLWAGTLGSSLSLYTEGKDLWKSIIV